MSGRLPRDLERTPLPVVEEPVVQVAPTRAPLTPGEWVRRNLFSNGFNGVLTIASAALVLFLGVTFFAFTIGGGGGGGSAGPCDTGVRTSSGVWGGQVRTTAADLESFKESANRKDVSGDGARHARRPGQPQHCFC